ncbi:CBS domain-containing protein [Prevotella sp. HUN102]|uniref:CBS domain-containing protein n=1 Tax=Prevotella sp. HUN102 TaxID=1392486 RepID=UPI0005600D44|nr:CBS domain-containing protein [Prevotella sp. HUN102]
MDFKQKIEQIKKDKKPQTITPRELLNGLNCYKRTSRNCAYIDNFLEENQLEVSPNYTDVWIDSPIEIRHKEIAKTKIPKDPIKRVQILEAANKIPKYVNNDDSLRKAITIMQMNKFSQLPVTNNRERGIIGYISWETICEARFNGVQSDNVKDYIKKEIQVIEPDTPLLDAMKVIYEHDFAVVIGKDKSLQGIITTADIASEFLLNTMPFLLLEEIEKSIRVLFNGEFLLEDIKKICDNAEKEINSIDDLSFGHYQRIIETPGFWDKLKIYTDKKILTERLEAIRKIRNEIMHFTPDSIDEEAIGLLIDTSKYLATLIKYKYQEV